MNEIQKIDRMLLKYTALYARGVGSILKRHMVKLGKVISKFIIPNHFTKKMDLLK